MKLRPLNTFRDLSRKLGKGRFGARIWAFPEFGVVYISNPKSACSTIKEQMRQLSGVPDLSPSNVHRLAIHRVDEILRASDEKGMALKDHFVFSSVRDPIRRVVSGFNDKFAARNPVQSAFRSQLSLPDETIIDWPFFMRHLRTTPLKDMNVHWRPQHLNLFHGQIRVDRIVRVETLQPDLESVLLPHFPGKTLQEVHRNSGGKKLISAQDISLKDRLALLRLYAADLHLYGYGAWWERLITLPDYWSYKRNPARYNALALNRRRLI